MVLCLGEVKRAEIHIQQFVEIYYCNYYYLWKHHVNFLFIYVVLPQNYTDIIFTISLFSKDDIEN